MYGRDYRLGYGLTVAQGGALHVELGVDAHRRESPRRGPTWTRGAHRTAPSPACVVNGRLRHMLIGDARVSKADGSQALDLQR